MNVRDCVARLKSRKEPAPLVPAQLWDAELDREIERLLPDTDPLKSALFLWNDNLTRAHEIAQEIKTQTGSYLHGIMHRREPDYENSKYWFHKVGEHPNFPAVRATALELLKEKFGSLEDVRDSIETTKKWDAFRMVDWCQQAARRNADEDFVKFLCALQTREIELLANSELQTS
jgi:hypothetical protein